MNQKQIGEKPQHQRAVSFKDGDESNTHSSSEGGLLLPPSAANNEEADIKLNIWPTL